MNPDDGIFVAGHRGLAGSAIVRRLRAAGFSNLILKDRSELDLTHQNAVYEFFDKTRPRYVFLAAAKAGGILANSTRPAQFMRDNLAIQINVIDAAYRNGTQKLIFLGSNCIYPKNTPQPIPETAVLTGPLDPTIEGYAIAKIAGLRMGQTYRREYGFNVVSIMPPNLYGPFDNFHLTSAHVLPALLRKFQEAIERDAGQVEIWGTGTQRREFLHVDDLADACLYLMQNYNDPQLINIGWGVDISIAELAKLMARIVNFRGSLHFDESKPDGPARKLLDVTRLKRLGWSPKIDLERGIRSTYDWYLGNRSIARQ